MRKSILFFASLLAMCACAKIVEEDAAWVPLFSLQHQYVLGDKVEHFTPHWAGYSDFNVYNTILK